VGAKEGYTGKERDAETGLDYFGARYYLAAIGRFGAIDRFFDQYPTISPYQYAGNNPLNLIDINGDSLWVGGNKPEAALKDLQDLAGSDQGRVSVDENGKISVNTDGYETGTNPGLDIIVKIVLASERVSYEVSSDALDLDARGAVINAISNRSTTHRYINTELESRESLRGIHPSNGLDGQIIIKDGIRFGVTSDHGKTITEIPRSQVVGHELSENYYRTIERKNYAEAHGLSNQYFFGGQVNGPVIVIHPIVKR
jgi:RHS repeat-associated protein